MKLSFREAKPDDVPAVYAACGYRECGRAQYKGTPLAYYELVF